MEEAYQIIADELVKISTEGFDFVTLAFEAQEAFLSLTLTCQMPDGAIEKPRISGLSASRIDDAFDLIKSAWIGEKFSGGVFELYSNGKFNFQVRYS